MIVALVRRPPSRGGDLTLLTWTDIAGGLWHTVVGMLIILNGYLKATVEE